MNCPKCGEENGNEAKFCRNCGTALENPVASSTHDKNKIIIIALIAVIAVLAIGVLFAGGVFKKDVPLETRDFAVFKMDAPVGSVFEEYASVPSYGNTGGFIFLENVGKYRDKVYMFEVSTLSIDTWPDEFQFERKEGDITILKDKTGQTNLYYATCKIDEFTFSLTGEDPETLVKMLKSIEITEPAELSSQSSQTSSSQTSSAPSSSSITILGGSFSTGSAEEDKTYARINVGTQNAGKSVVVQIYYSRDGNNLNNGNMVPATVHSDGYLEITSADAYHYYPDHATINIYDTSNNLLTTKSVDLAPTSGTQTF